MKDNYGREIDYLRISLTDHCNLRCVYCLPIDGLTFAPDSELLTAAEIERVGRAAAEVGIQKVRLTGGEPTLRADIAEIVRRLGQIDGLKEVVMTTNGYRLPAMAHKLAEAGLKRVNIHVDSLDPERLPRLMRLGVVKRFWAGIAAAEQAGLLPIKLNVVMVRGYNDEDTVELARLTLDRPWQVRFIELMPFAGPAEMALGHYISSDEIKHRIEAELGPLFPLNDGRLDGETRRYRLAGSQGMIGFISPVSQPYCDNCHRLRLTADGRLRMCLLADQEINLRDILRNGGTHHELVALFKQAIQAKPAGHQLKAGIHPEARLMSQIGG